MQPPDQTGHKGRSHSLRFTDAQRERESSWYETAFMLRPFSLQRPEADPFTLNPGREALQAINPGQNTNHVEWPFAPRIPGQLDEWISQWEDWPAKAASGGLTIRGLDLSWGEPARP